jgi:hypothetical protein
MTQLYWRERFESFGDAASWMERTLPEAIAQPDTKLRFADINYQFDFCEQKGYWYVLLQLWEVVHK